MRNKLTQVVPVEREVYDKYLMEFCGFSGLYKSYQLRQNPPKGKVIFPLTKTEYVHQLRHKLYEVADENAM